MYTQILAASFLLNSKCDKLADFCFPISNNSTSDGRSLNVTPPGENECLRPSEENTPGKKREINHPYRLTPECRCFQPKKYIYFF